MITINENFLKLQENYLFVTIANKVKEYQKKSEYKKLINLGIGDFTRPIPKIVAEAMKKAADQMNKVNKGTEDLFKKQSNMTEQKVRPLVYVPLFMGTKVIVDVIKLA